MTRPLSIAIIGAGMGGLATAAALRRVGHRRHRLRTGHAIRADRRRHPDRLQRHEGAARAGAGGETARAIVLSALLEQPRLAHRRSQIRHDFRRKRRTEIWRALSAGASRRSACGARQRRSRRMRQAQPQTGRAGGERRGRSADIRQRCKRDGRRRDRGRRHSFPRERHSVRRLRRSVLPGGSPIAPPIPPRCSAAKRSTIAPNGGARTATSSSITSSRTAARSTSSPASRSRISGSSRGRRRATSGNCARRSRASTARSNRCWPRAPTCTNGRSSIAIRWSDGRIAT